MPGPETEATIDAEWASAAAPNAAIEIASCADTTTNFGGFVALENLLNSSGTPPAVVSLSYGASEVSLGAAFNAYVNSLYEQGASEGVSIFTSAGDAGAAKYDQGKTTATHGIGISGFASTPYNVAVGGTDFGDTFAGTTSAYWSSTNTSTYGSAISYVPEISWNGSCASALIATHLGYATTYGVNGLCNSVASNSPLLTTEAGGGGPSGCATGASNVTGIVGGSCAGYPKPYWQSVVGNPNDGVRDIPDVSLFAAAGYWHHYYVVCWSDVTWGGSQCAGSPSNWSGFGGTSFAAPIMAGIQALINQKTGEREGNPAPIYYALAAKEYGVSGSAVCNSTLGNGVDSGCTFYDVMQGDTDVNCTGSVNCYTPSGTNGVLSVSSSSYQPAFTATAGWDFATGIGTVNAYNLVENWPQTGITAVSGGPQTAVINSGFAAPLVAKITNASGNPVSGITVTFQAPASGASGTFAGGIRRPQRIPPARPHRRFSPPTARRKLYGHRHGSGCGRRRKFRADQHLEHAGKRERRQRLPAKRNDQYGVLLTASRGCERREWRSHERDHCDLRGAAGRYGSGRHICGRHWHCHYGWTRSSQRVPRRQQHGGGLQRHSQRHECFDASEFRIIEYARSLWRDSDEWIGAKCGHSHHVRGSVFPDAGRLLLSPQQPGSRHSKPALTKILSRPSISAWSLTRPEPGTIMALTRSLTSLAVDDLGDGAQILDTRIGAGTDEDAIDGDVGNLLAALQAHIGQCALDHLALLLVGHAVEPRHAAGHRDHLLGARSPGHERRQLRRVELDLAIEMRTVVGLQRQPMTSNSKAAGRFGKQDFRYVAAEDVYICPAGQRLAYFFTTEDKGQTRDSEQELIEEQKRHVTTSLS